MLFRSPRLDANGRAKQTKGAHINLALLEQGGDFFDLANVSRYRRGSTPAEAESANRKDVVAAAQQTLLDLVAAEPSATPTVHYDAMAFVPARIQRVSATGTAGDWAISPSPVDPRLSLEVFFARLVATAKLRGFI